MTFTQLSAALAKSLWHSDRISEVTKVAPFRIDAIREGRATAGLISAEENERLINFVRYY